MNFIFKSIYTALTASWLSFMLLVMTVANAQPSSSIDFVFRLYDKGQIINGKKFCQEWHIENSNGGFISPCDKNAPGSFYDDSSKYFYVHVGAIYPPYVFTLSNSSGSMTLYFTTGTSLICDSLTLVEGEYLFDQTCGEGAKISLPRIHGEKFCRLGPIDWRRQKIKFEESRFFRKYQQDLIYDRLVTAKNTYNAGDTIRFTVKLSIDPEGNQKARLVETMSCACGKKDFYYKLYRVEGLSEPELVVNNSESQYDKKCECKYYYAQFDDGQQYFIVPSQNTGRKISPGNYFFEIIGRGFIMTSNIFTVLD